MAKQVKRRTRAQKVAEAQQEALKRTPEEEAPRKVTRRVQVNQRHLLR